MIEPDVDQTECIWCHALFTPHPKDGIGECPECADLDWSHRMPRTGRGQS